MRIKKLLKIQDHQYSFQFRIDHVPQNHNVWHYHEEVEFIYIKKGSGTLFIGDCIQPFQAGACVLIGKNTPHYWLFDDIYFCEAVAESYVIHFREDFAGDMLFNIPEMAELKTMLEEAQKGLFLRLTPSNIAVRFEKMAEEHHADRIISLLQVLHALTSIRHKCVLISNFYISHYVEDDLNRMNLILQFIRANFKSKIELDTIANVSGMTKNSFCRYFKQKTNRTMTEFIAEMKITYSCKVLATTSLSVKECCFESGFNNFASFHKVFKRITGKTPQQYRKEL